jgi:hypothetical protein
MSNMDENAEYIFNIIRQTTVKNSSHEIQAWLNQSNFLQQFSFYICNALCYV